MIPKVGKVYNCYDDGKITPSKQYTVEVAEVIPFDKVDKETLKQWEECKINTPWLFADETDYFIKYKNGENNESGVFARTKSSKWFGLGNFINAGLLDVDNSLIESVNLNN